MPSLMLSEQDLKHLTPGARAEVYGLFDLAAGISVAAMSAATPTSAGPAMPPAELDPEVRAAFDWQFAADLTLKQVQTWMEAASPKTKDGMRVIAEHGPVFHSTLLTEAGIDNLPHFQSRTTMRTRTVTGDKSAFLLTWDEWAWNEDETVLSGRYAVTPLTHQSLRRYFGLD